MTQDPGSGAPMSERMQSLLSRAVEDQRSEQRSLDGALAEIRTQIGELSESLAHSQDTPSDSPDPASVASLSAEIRDGLRRTGDRVDTVARMVAQRGEDILALQASLSALSEQVRVQTEGVNGSLSTVVQRLVALQTDMTALGSYVAGFAESASVAGAGSDELDARIRAIVGGALVGTERRLGAHVEETVLALAEVLLRPRGPGDDAEQLDDAEAQVADAEVPTGDAETHSDDGEAPVGEWEHRAQSPTTASPAAQEAPSGAAPERLSPAASEGLSPTAPEGPGPVPVSSPPPTEAAPAAVASPGRLTATAAAGQQSHDAGPRVPPPWTTIDPDDERRRGWFRSRD